MILKVDLIFFSSQRNHILISIDTADWGDFLRDKETI